MQVEYLRSTLIDNIYSANKYQPSSGRPKGGFLVVGKYRAAQIKESKYAGKYLVIKLEVST